MEEQLASPVRCSGCRSTSFTMGPDGRPICDYCGAPCVEPEPLCPRCGSPYDAETDRLCLSCGALLARECPVCGALSPTAAGNCATCGQILDVTDALFERLATRAPDQFRRVRETGTAVKSKEAAASRARAAQMWADEKAQREAWERAQAERDRRDRLLLMVFIGLVGFAILVAISVAVLGAGRPPVPLF